MERGGSMIARGRKSAVTPSMFARSTAQELESRIAVLDAKIVLSAHNIERRRQLFAERLRLERKLEAIKTLSKGN